MLHQDELESREQEERPVPRVLEFEVDVLLVSYLLPLPPPVELASL